MPEIQPIPSPETYSVDALQWIQHHGINPIRPPIRSSHLETYRANPLVFFLRYRCGIVHPFDINKALTEGGWFHTAMELNASSTDDLSVVWSERKKEIRNACDHLGLGDTVARNLLTNEKIEMLSAMAWFAAAKDLHVRSDSYQNFLETMDTLGVEMKIKIDPNPLHRVPVVVQIDRLLYDPSTNKVWIFDAKTTSRSASHRVSTCSFEFQTLLYIYAVQTALVSGLLQSHCPDLPADAKLGGMIHWVVSKPSIRLSLYDRDYTEVKTMVRNKPVIKKHYTGEPLFENYLTRVKHWMKAEDRYAHLAVERRTDPVIEFSWTHYNGEPLQENAWFMHDLRTLEEASTCKPVPALFPPSASDMRGYGKPSCYLPFAVNHPIQWPNIFLQNRFVIDHRD